MPAKRAAPARKPAPKAKGARLPKQAPSTVTSAWRFSDGGKRLKPYVPTECPICGSKRLDVRPPDSPTTVMSKVTVGVVTHIPLLIEFQARASCMVCGWRSEGTY